MAQALDELARDGARRMIAAALEAEMEQRVEPLRHPWDENDRTPIVWSGKSHCE